VSGTRETNYRLGRVWHYAPPLRVLDRLEIEAGELFTPLIGHLRAGPTPTQGLPGLVALGKDRFGLNETEIAASIFFLIMAGIVTTAGMLGSAIFLALSHPTERAWWRGNAQAVKSGLDEVVRMAAPFRQLVRVAGADLRLDDIAIEEGTSMILKLEQAHRDPGAYPDPHRFDPARRGPPHFGLSAGAHACLGAALAYREAAILLDELFRRFDVNLLDGTPRWEEHLDLRRLERLPLILRPSANG
jgi:cytochrome P450